MFAAHQPIIGQWARAHPDNFARAQLLAILSARQPFEYVGEDMQAVLDGDYKPLFTWKLKAWLDAKEHSAKRLAACEMIYHRGQGIQTEAELLAEITSWHGLSFIKGGFVAQLVYGMIGCLDTRNQDTFGIGPRDFRELRQNASYKSRLAHSLRYVKACRKLGGCQYLWDLWCEGYNTSTRSSRLKDGWQASAEHCRILGLDPGSDCGDIPF